MSNIIYVISLIFMGVIGLVVSMETVYNIRRMVAIGRFFPRSSGFFAVTTIFLFLLSFYHLSAGTILDAGLVFSVAAIPGIIFGFKADPYV